MKPRNFPARKLARQIAAKAGLLTCQVAPSDMPDMQAARAVRTKKRR